MSLIVYFSRQSPELPGQYDDKYLRLSVYEGTGEAQGIYVQILLEKGYDLGDVSSFYFANDAAFTEDDLQLVRRAMDGIPGLAALTMIGRTTPYLLLKVIREDLKIDVRELTNTIYSFT